MELFSTEPFMLDDLPLVDGKPLSIDGHPYSLPADALKALADMAVPKGMPFILNDDASYASLINRFFRDLPSQGCRSVHTWQSYARDLVTFGRFLFERCGGKGLLEATLEDVRHYYRVRRLTGLNAVDPRTWNRGIAALDKFYQWALSVKLITALPFTYKAVVIALFASSAPQIIQRNTAFEPTGPDDRIKCVSLDHYLAFRNIGLLGQLPDGSVDHGFRGRNRLRNAAFSELLVTTGARLEEAGSLLTAELPNIDDRRWNGLKTCKVALAKPTTKGDKGRTIRIPKRVLRDFIKPYLVEERENAALNAYGYGAYEARRGAIHVTAWRTSSCVLQEASDELKTVRYEELAVDARRQLYSIKDGKPADPGLLWLNESGMPVTLNSIEAVFGRASERCQKFGIDIWITPHVLRHTFAVYMLSNLIKAILCSDAPAGISTGARIYRRLFFDPLRTLQRMLGHSSITTTYKYLTYLQDADELIDQAVNSWGEQLNSPAEYTDGGLAA